MVVSCGYEPCCLLVAFYAAGVFPDACKSADRDSCASSSTGSAAEREEARNLRATDRLLWVVISRLWKPWQSTLLIVNPQTVIVAPKGISTLKLGIEISQATVAKYMLRRHKPPSQPWRTFLENHVQQLVAIDFLVVPTISFRLLFVFVVFRSSAATRPSLQRDQSSNRRMEGKANWRTHFPGIALPVIFCMNAVVFMEQNFPTELARWESWKC